MSSLKTGVSEADMNLLAGLLAVEKKKQDDAKAKATEVSVVKEGTKLILPEKWTPEQAIDALKRKIEEENTAVAIHEEINAFPLDGAYALMKVLQAKFGWAQAVPTPGFFGPNPPVMANLEIGVNENTQVIWGGFVVPGVEGQLQTGATRGRDGSFKFVISGKVKQRYKQEVQDLAQEVRVYVRKHSVYKGKAIKLHTDEDGEIMFDNPPSFLDVTRVNEEELTFSAETAEQVSTNLFTPIEKTAQCRKYGVPLKRGVLLEGPYGTGKTLTAYVTAKKAEANGWTFIYLDRVTALKSAIQFANGYGPAVIFAEDIDRVVSGGRTVKVDDVLNQIDGVDSKGQELIVILTSNFVDNIDKAMMRPGRLDAVISVTAPDAKAAEKLVRLYSRGLVPPEADLTEAGKELQGQIPAVIREVVERSKLAAISRLGTDEDLQLIAQDLVVAAKGMKRHLELMQPPRKPELSPEAQVGHALKKLVGLNGHGSLLEHAADVVQRIAVERLQMEGVPALPEIHQGVQ